MTLIYPTHDLRMHIYVNNFNNFFLLIFGFNPAISKKLLKKISCIGETMNLLNDVDRSTDTVLFLSDKKNFEGGFNIFFVEGGCLNYFFFAVIFFWGNFFLGGPQMFFLGGGPFFFSKKNKVKTKIWRGFQFFLEVGPGRFSEKLFCLLFTISIFSNIHFLIYFKRLYI